jgi:hypothetical protein
MIVLRSEPKKLPIKFETLEEAKAVFQHVLLKGRELFISGDLKDEFDVEKYQYHFDNLSAQNEVDIIILFHEVAHHIDLSSENYNRNRMVNYLYGYFCNKVTDRVEYFLKSEELIARAAEISLLLLLGRYEKFKEMYDKNEIDEVTLVRAVNETFSKTSYSNFMSTILPLQNDLKYTSK